MGLFAGHRPKAGGFLELYFFGTHLRRLVRLFAGDRPKVKGYLEQLFFGSSQRVSGEIFRKGLTKSWKLSGATLFRAIAAGRLRGLAVGGKRQLEADGRKHFSGVYLRRLAGLFVEDWPKAEGGLA